MDGYIRILFFLETDFATKFEIFLQISVCRYVEPKIVATEDVGHIKIVCLIRCERQHFVELVGLAVGQSESIGDSKEEREVYKQFVGIDWMIMFHVFG